MKIPYFTSALAGLLAIGTAWAVTPQLSGLQISDKPVTSEIRKAQPRVAANNATKPVQVRRVSEKDIEDLNLQPLVQEDFSLMAKGSEQEPYLYSYGFVMIPEDVTHAPGWVGAGVAECGGKLGLVIPGYDGVQGGGCINTPLGDYSGHLIIKYRVKALSANGIVFCNVCKGGIEYPSPAVDGMYIIDMKDKTDWEEVIVDVVNPNADEDGFVQINAATFNGDGFLIDKIEVYRDIDYVYAPNILSASDFKKDGFTASWNKVTTAADYLVSLYEDTRLSDDNFLGLQDFEDITAGGELAASDIPEGWDIHLTGTNQTTANKGEDDSKAVVLSKDEDYIQLPYNGGTFLSMEMHLRNLEPDQNDRPGYFYVEVRDPGTGDWKTYAFINASNISDVTGYRFSTKDIEAQYGAAYPFEGMYDAVRVHITNASSKGGLAVDNIEYETTPPTKRVTIKDKMPVKENTVSFSGLDPEAEHYFSIIARNGENLSTATSPFHAFGIADITGLKVTDIDPRGGVTAEWDRVPRADRYEVGSFEVEQAKADAKDYALIDEDFSGVAVRNPVSDPLFIGNENSLTSLDEYTAMPGWTGRGNILAKGMLGCIEDPIGIFEIYTPYITLSNNDGQYNVYVKVYAEKGTQLAVQGTDTYQVMTFPETGTYEGTIPMVNGQDQDQLMFYTIEGGMFLIDELRVMQDIKAGDRFYTRLYKAETTDCDYRFSIEPEEGKLYSVQVQAFQTLFKKTCKTQLTPMQTVDFFDVGVEGVGSEELVLNVSGLDGALRLTSSRDVDAAVADMNGRLRFFGVVDGEKTIELPAGIYVVTAGDKSYKLIVK